MLGPVQILVAEMELGVPSSSNETVYTPFESVRIVIPAGAWVTRGGRGLTPLTLRIFLLPEGTGAPLEACGVAVDLGPRDQTLALPISISLPCTKPAQAGPFRLNTTSRRWEPAPPLDLQEEGAVWGNTTKLGVHSALAWPVKANEGYQVTLGGSGDHQVGTAVGASFGAMAVVVMMIGAVISVRRGRAKGEKSTRVAASVDTDLCFTTEV
jgi:hypothetical protein